MELGEKKELKDIIVRYNRIYGHIDAMEKEILNIQRKKDALLDELKNLEFNEEHLLKRLKRKYGDDEVTPNKLLKIINE